MESMWIVIGVIALIVIVALIALAVRSGNRRKLNEAADLRRDAHQRERELERQHSVAREHEHRAGAAEQEARAKVAEADRLRADADQHRTAVAEQRHDVSRMEQAADKLDPRHRADDRVQGDARDHVRDQPASGDERPGDHDGPLTATGGRHSATGDRHPDGGPGIGDRPGDPGRDLENDVVDTGSGAGPSGRHRPATDAADPRDPEPGIVDKMLGRTDRDEPRR